MAFLLLLIAKGLLALPVTDTIPAQYPGGQAAWIRYLHKHFQQPDSASQEHSAATLVFHVSAKGDISHVRMVKGDTLLCKTFTALLLNSSPWQPAKFRQKAVASTRTFFINYHLQEE